MRYNAIMNTLYYGDCLTIMKDKMEAGSVDLIYLDPPFNSKRDYNAIYRDETGRSLPDQIEAFKDTWYLDAERAKVIRELPKQMGEHGINGTAADFLAAFLVHLMEYNSSMAAYLGYMAERLIWMRTILKDTGTIYLHCDPTASHYLKIAMDAIFGRSNFRNEIVWCYAGGGIPKLDFPRKHDIILRYTKGNKYNYQPVYRPYSPGTQERGRTPVKGKYYDRGLREEGTPVNDWWSDVRKITSPTDPEKLGYPTQKSVELLDRIIYTSSNEGNVVFDPFCGCGTTMEAAVILKRKWIGVDILIHAVKRVVRKRLQERLHLKEGRDFEIDGVPSDLEGAVHLWERDPYHFQQWCVEQVEGYVTTKRTADGGIDGRIYFDMPGEKTLQSMALEVKGGRRVGIGEVRKLNNALNHPNIQMAGLIVMFELSERQKVSFNKEMALAGDMQIGYEHYPRLQLLTVQEILDGKRFQVPSPAERSGKDYTIKLPGAFSNLLTS